MLIRVGSEIVFTYPAPTPVVLMLYMHPVRSPTIRRLEHLQVRPATPIQEYFDAFGNRCGRAVVPAGQVVFRNDAVVEDCGLPDLQVPNAPQIPVQNLPYDTLRFLLASRYCEVDSELKDIAWGLFGHATPGWPRSAGDLRLRSCAHSLRLPAGPAESDRIEAYRERTGVCRDFTHLGDHVLPLPQHSGPILHRLFGRHRRAGGAVSDGLQRLVRGVSRRTMVCVRPAQPHPADRPGVDGPRPRRRRRGDHDHLWAESTANVRSLDLRSARRSKTAGTCPHFRSLRRKMADCPPILAVFKLLLRFDRRSRLFSSFEFQRFVGFGIDDADARAAAEQVV